VLFRTLRIFSYLIFGSIGPNYPNRVETIDMTILPLAAAGAALRETRLPEILSRAVSLGASDVHIKAGAGPIIRVHAQLRSLNMGVTSADEVEEMVLSAMGTDRERDEFRTQRECDFALEAPHIGRFRVNAFRSKGDAAMVLRYVSDVIPTLDGLGLPEAVFELSGLSSGLILVCGPTGSGKSTTLAAMIGQINAHRSCHVLTIEDPIEFLHRDDQATVSQRELHTDTVSFERALRSGMRQDPDVILVGEVRDADTMRIALQAAETGHLVLASLHARSVVDAVHRVIDLVPPAQQRQARAAIAESLRGVICQSLVETAEGSERIVVSEVALGTTRVREAIADPEKTADLSDIVAEGGYYGMHSFHQEALRLVLEGKISVQVAETVVPSVADLHVSLRRSGFKEMSIG
jgi:twitching motility protein PilT